MQARIEQMIGSLSAFQENAHAFRYGVGVPVCVVLLGLISTSLAKDETLPADTDWWSLKELVAPPLPGKGHPIDAFVESKLAETALEVAPRADRRALVRRLYVDLHGFLPTPQEVRNITEGGEGAISELIEALLASPRYGERWARHWLDVVHFADSHGCEHDVKRPNAWRYRDYVIERLNVDVPWARFIREQLAADVFFPEEPQLTAALGFIAAGPLELSRAGTAPVTFDYLDRDDMVTQTMAAFVSTTANCARCHTHKFDPIAQEDYYALQAVFAGVGKGDVEFDSSPEVRDQRRAMETLLTACQNRDPEVLLLAKHASVVRAWAEAREAKKVIWRVLDPEVSVASGSATLTQLEDGSVVASGPVAAQETYTVTSLIDSDLKSLSAMRLDVLRDERLPKNGPGRAENGNFHLSEIDLQWLPDATGASVRLEISKATADFDQEGWTSAQAIDGNTTTGWAIYPRVDESHHIVFELKEPLALTAGGKLVVSLKQLHPPKHHIGRFRLAVTDAEEGLAEVLPLEVTQALAKPVGQRSESEVVAMAALALRSHAERKLAALPAKEVVYGVSSSWSHAKKLPSPQEPKVVQVLRRGAFDQPLYEVGPGALSAISSLPGRFDLSDPTNEASRRAALAEWLAHHDNPLTWRSVVNRVWHYHFGRGLCDTPNDFGRMGSEPTHPDLLDWLAVWFRDEAKGSLKELHRLILTSATWQRSSRTSVGENRDNRLLGRRNRQRIDAEVFRDSALRMAGQLDLTMGGPGIEQFVKSKGVQSTPSLDYEAYDWESPGATRRSIYRVVWRGIPDPFMEAMDFPDLGLLAPKRGDSVSALQSLAVFNNDFVLQASEWMAARVKEEVETLEKQVSRAAQLAWLRELSATEGQAFLRYAEEHGLAALCRVVLNSNEFLFVE